MRSFLISNAIQCGFRDSAILFLQTLAKKKKDAEKKSLHRLACYWQRFAFLHNCKHKN